jgi:hypothetical protein
MFATQSGDIQYQQGPWDYFSENPDVSNINQKDNFSIFLLFIPQGSSAGPSRYTRQVTLWLWSLSTEIYRIICNMMWIS